MADDDSAFEDNEEESLVYVEFEGTAGTDVFSNKNIQLDMIGLDMEHPIMKVNGRYYEGTYEDAVGTYMFFEKDNNPIVDDSTFDLVPKLKYSEKTSKILKMKRVFVKPRLEILGDSNHSSCIPNIETIKEAGIPPRYQKEASNHWLKMRDERLEALNEYLEKQKIREEKRQQGIEVDSESDEDNPFAMYKLKTVEANEMHVPEVYNLTAVVSRPTTSRDNVLPCELQFEENTQSIDLSNQAEDQRCHRISSGKKCEEAGTEDTEKVRDCDGNKYKNGKTTDEESEIVSRNERQKLQEYPRMPIAAEETPTEKSTSMSEDFSKNLTEFISNKKLEKEKKRVAKMKEISERLKRTADEIKSKTTQ